jgi:hypothetical protein
MFWGCPAWPVLNLEFPAGVPSDIEDGLIRAVDLAGLLSGMQGAQGVLLASSRVNVLTSTGQLG